MGLPRKKNYAGRWDVLIDKSTKCLNRLFEFASKRKRNYILDQVFISPCSPKSESNAFHVFAKHIIALLQMAHLEICTLLLFIMNSDQQIEPGETQQTTNFSTFFSIFGKKDIS